MVGRQKVEGVTTHVPVTIDSPRCNSVARENFVNGSKENEKSAWKGRIERTHIPQDRRISTLESFNLLFSSYSCHVSPDENGSRHLSQKLLTDSLLYQSVKIDNTFYFNC